MQRALCVFLRRASKTLLLPDHYPYFGGPGEPSDTRERYVSDMATLRKYSLQASIPFWTFFNIEASMPPRGPEPDGQVAARRRLHYHHLGVTDGQLRWQVWTALAFGARGLLYYSFLFPTGIIDFSLQPTYHAQQAKVMNAVLRALGPTLMNLTSTAIVRINATEDTNDTITEKLRGGPLTTILPGDSGTNRDLTLGFFDHDDGEHAGIMIVNHDPVFADRPRLHFASHLGIAGEHVMEVAQSSGLWVPLRPDDHDMAPARSGIGIALPAGGGRLFMYRKPSVDSRSSALAPPTRKCVGCAQFRDQSCLSANYTLFSECNCGGGGCDCVSCCSGQAKSACCGVVPHAPGCDSKPAKPLLLPGGARQGPIGARLNESHAVFAGGYGASNYTDAADVCSTTECSAGDPLSVRMGAMGAATSPAVGAVFAGGEAASACKGNACLADVFAVSDVYSKTTGSRVYANQSALSQARYEAAVAECGGYVYAAGGENMTDDFKAKASARIDVFDPKTMQWRPLGTELSTPRYHHTAACVTRPNGQGHTLLVAGGMTGAVGTKVPMKMLASVEGFNVQANGSLQPLARTPDPLKSERYVLCGAQAGERAVFLGGVGSAEASFYDADGRQVATAQLDGPVYRHTCVSGTVGGEAIACAVGGCDHDPVVLAQVQCFRSDGSRHPVAQNLSVARYSLGAAIVSEPRPTLIAAGGIGPVPKTKNPHSCAAPNVCQWTGVVDAIPL